jgi:hypothetical protein
MSKARDLADSAQEINILDGKSFLDEDNLASDSATGIASQQSIKAYVDGITTTNITSTGALNSGSITSGFGNIDNGSSTITTTGAITGGSFVIGSADINENDLESIDGITAGTVSASKAVVVNTNKDITGFRNITATGTISGSLSGSLSSTTTATTQAESDDSTKIATTAYVTDKITTLIGGAPSTLNDLNELAAAINDDANYNSTLTTALGTKLPKAGGTMTGDVLYNDNVKAKFGAGSDLQIYHNGSDSYIQDEGTGRLNIRGNDGVRIQATGGSENMGVFNQNGSVDLYYDNAKKLATTSTGIQVTGNIANASGDFTLDVAGDINLDADGSAINLKDGGTRFGALYKSSNDFLIYSAISDGDMKLQGLDGSSVITALTLDMSNGGRANFNNDIGLNDDRGLRLGSNDDSVIFNDGSNTFIRNSTANQDIYFQGNDDGSPNITALRLDMSDAGTAIFNSRVAIANGTASLPSYTFSGDTNTGMFRPNSDNLGFSVGGTQRAFISATQFNVNTKIVATELDINGNADISGNVTVAGTVDGRDLAADGVRLDTMATNANNYSHPTGNGNNHIPSGGSTDQILKYASAGTAQWADASGGSRVLLSRSVMNNTSSYVFTGVDSTKYDSYYIEFNGIVCTQDSKDFLMKFSDNGGSSYKGYGDVRGTLFYHKGGSQLSDTWNEDMRISRQQGFTTSGNFGANVSGYVMIMNAHGGNTVTTQAMGSATYRAYSNEQVVTLYSCGTAEESYSRNIWTDWNAFKLQFDNGNMQKGTISAFGILK